MIAPGSPSDYRDQMARIREAIEVAPGIVSVGHGLTLPFSYVGGNQCCWLASMLVGDERWFANMQPVNLDYFATLGIPLLAGSLWSSAEAQRTPIPALLSASGAVSRFGSVEAAIDATFTDDSGDQTYEVFGVVGDVRHYGLDRDPAEMAYLPLNRLPFAMSTTHVAVRAEAGASASIGFADALRDAVWSVTPDVPLPFVKPLDQVVNESIATRRFESVLISSFGFASLVLAAAGLYSTFSHHVSQRRREMSIRIALGCSQRSAVAHILKASLLVVCIGAGLGLVVAGAATKYLETRVWGIATTDPISVASALGLLLSVAVTASWMPARRAGRLYPEEVLRSE